MSQKVELRLLKDIYGGKTGDVLKRYPETAAAWVHAELAEYVKPVTKAPDLEARMKKAPENRVVKSPANRAKAAKAKRG